MNPPPLPKLPNEIYFTFSGEINQDSTRRIFDKFAAATQEAQPVTKIHLLIESYGGTVGDGVCLHNFFHGYPIPIRAYNIGTLMSAAVTAFLGVKERVASLYAAFMVHGATSPPLAATAGASRSALSSITIDNGRIEAILRSQARLTEAQWNTFKHYELHLTAADAVAAGIAHEIAEWSPPSGCRMYNI